MKREFADILDECIEIVAGGGDIEDCLERYPDVAGELRPLLELVAAGHELLPARQEAAASKAAVRARIMAAGQARRAPAAAPPSESGRRRFLPRLRGALQPLLRPAFMAPALLVLAFSGTAVAASGAYPDSHLYPVKRALEEVRTAVATGDLDEAKVEVGHARARLDELQVMVAEDKTDYVAVTLERYRAHHDRAAAEIEAAAEAGADVSAVAAMLAEVEMRHDQLLSEIADSLPEDVLHEIEDELPAPAMEDEGGETGMGSPAGGGTAPAPAPAPGGEMEPPGDEPGHAPAGGGHEGGEPGGDMGGGYEQPMGGGSGGGEMGGGDDDGGGEPMGGGAHEDNMDAASTGFMDEGPMQQRGR